MLLNGSNALLDKKDFHFRDSFNWSTPRSFRPEESNLYTGAHCLHLGRRRTYWELACCPRLVNVLPCLFTTFSTTRGYLFGNGRQILVYYQYSTVAPRRRRGSHWNTTGVFPPPVACVVVNAAVSSFSMCITTYGIKTCPPQRLLTE